MDGASDGAIHDVVVLGAGFAGLYAARCCAMATPDAPTRPGASGGEATRRRDFEALRCVVLEASSEVGGRVKVTRDVAPWDVNLGPEFLHGDENSVLKRFVDHCGFACAEKEWPDRYYLGDDKALLSAEQAETTNADVKLVHELFDNLPGAPGDGDKDVTALEWLTKTVAAPERVIKLAENIYANDFCASLGKLGMRELIEEKKGWIYGEKYLVLDRPLREVALALADGLDVRLNWEIERVDYSQPGLVRVVRRGGKDVITARKCIVSLPITALRGGNAKNRVEFIPRLPAAKTRAAEAIAMGNAAKIFIGFNKILWPSDMFDVVCTNCFLPEFWITEYPKSPLAREAKTSEEAERIAQTVGLVTFFIAGDLANEIDKMEEKVVFDRAIEQLDMIFNVPCKEHVTTKKIVSWSRERLVQGAYTHPTVNAGNSRTLLAASISDTLFFAGEATHTGVNPCLQGAMETGARAVAQVRAAVFGVGSSKL
jgi:hypothetical protein